MEIEQLADHIFGSEPKDSFFYSVEFDTNDTEGLFQSMCVLFTIGMKKLYGDGSGRVDIGNIQKQDLIKINKYFKSVGIEFFLNDSQHKRESELSKHHLIVTNNGVKYELFFDFLKL